MWLIKGRAGPPHCQSAALTTLTSPVKSEASWLLSLIPYFLPLVCESLGKALKFEAQLL